MLGEIKDPSSIEALYTRALDIPSYDDGRSIAKKCIWALVAIDTEGSWEKIKSLKALKDPVIDDFLKLYLK
jgi:HEAT repeat protein